MHKVPRFFPIQACLVIILCMGATSLFAASDSLNEDPWQLIQALSDDVVVLIEENRSSFKNNPEKFYSELNFQIIIHCHDRKGSYFTNLFTSNEKTG